MLCESLSEMALRAMVFQFGLCLVTLVDFYN